MKILSLLFLTFSFVFSLEPTAMQLQMLKDAGYAKVNTNKTTNNINKKQVVNNTLDKNDSEELVEAEIKNNSSENLRKNELSDIDNELRESKYNLKNLDKDDEKYDLLSEEIKKEIINLNRKKFQIIQDIEYKKQQKKISEIELKRYGSLFFNNKNSLNPYSMPTPNNYKLNFSDKISLNIYGSKNASFELIVNNNGTIVIPQVGEIEVIGRSFQEIKKQIKEEVDKAYPASTSVLVNMSEFTAIQVTISGLVKSPGLYNLTSFSTIKDALQIAGGILEKGSYRNIIIKRDGKHYKTFDLYNLIAFGDLSNDLVLRNSDVILVKKIGKEISLGGESNINARFELKRNEKFKDLLRFSAGLTHKANKKAIEVKRFEKNGIKVYSLNLRQFYSLKPKDGDEVNIYEKSTLGAKLIKISGNIVAPGQKAFPKDKKLSTFLKKELKTFGSKSYFKNDTNYDYALVKNDNKVRSFSLKNVLSAKEEVILTYSDEITIYKNSQLKEEALVYVKAEGLFLKKSEYKYFTGLTLYNLFNQVLFTGEKTSEDVDKSKIKIVRSKNGIVSTLMLDYKNNKNFKLLKSDKITFFEYSLVNDSSFASIKGEVFLPGTYSITQASTIKDLISFAGGFTKKVLFTNFEIARYSIEDNRRVRTIYTLDLKKMLDENFALRADDEIRIFSIPNWNEKMYVSIEGRVKFPGKYAIEEGEKLSSVIRRAGGFLNNAFIEGSVFTRVSVQKLQEKRLAKSLAKLKNKALNMSGTANEAGENLETKQRMLNAVVLLEKEAKTNKPIGRISLNLYHDIERFQKSAFDISLANNDKLFIPSMNDTITVVGEVLNQSTFVYNNELDANDYLHKAGGINYLADDDHIYIVKANGEAKRYENSRYWFNSNEVFKGDTIVVPLKLDTMSDLAFAKDVTSILYQLAITAASLHTVGAI